MRRQDLQAYEAGVYIAERIPNLGITRALGVAAPTNGAVGYAPGCIWQNIALAYAELTSLYVNTGTLASATWQAGNLMPGLLATVAELNRNNKASTRVVGSGANLTVTQALHDGKTIALAATAAVVLPAMSGSGSRYRFVCPQASAAVTITATAAHLFGGVSMATDSAFAAGTLFTVGWANGAAGFTVITLNGAATGGGKGDWIQIEDVASGVGIVSGQLQGSGTEATPFS